jgi:hypothetical protein
MSADFVATANMLDKWTKPSDQALRQYALEFARGRDGAPRSLRALLDEADIVCKYIRDGKGEPTGA